MAPEVMTVAPLKVTPAKLRGDRIVLERSESEVNLDEDWSRAHGSSRQTGRDDERGE